MVRCTRFNNDNEEEKQYAKISPLDDDPEPMSFEEFTRLGLKILTQKIVDLEADIDLLKKVVVTQDKILDHVTELLRKQEEG